MKKIKNLAFKYFYEKTSNREACYAAGKRSIYAAHLLIATPPGSVAQTQRTGGGATPPGSVAKMRIILMS